MKLGWDLRIGLNRYLTSWRSRDDPSLGEFVYGIDLYGLPQVVVSKNSVKLYRTGPWNGVQFSGTPINPTLAYNPKFIINSEEVYYEYDIKDQSTLTISALTYTGALQRLVWENSSQEWLATYTRPTECESYGHCGPNAVCTFNNDKICSCLIGYMPRSAQDWESLIWSGGCVRRSPLNCPDGEGFKKLEGVAIPDLLQFSINTSMTLKQCAAWKLWIEEKVFELVDEQMQDYSISTSEVVKCIQVGLLCVQKRPEDRPTMAYVLSALESESVMMAQPKQPGFYTEGGSLETELPLVGKQCGTAEMTLTMMSPR
ncbi:non-specific serine,threonine protein kinase [Sarracenia purpurea var. burkii]